MLRTWIIALLSIAIWAPTVVAKAHYDLAPLSHPGSTSISLAVEKSDFCCHEPAGDVCHLLSSGSLAALLTTKKSMLDLPPLADLAYTDLMPNRLLRKEGTVCYSDLPTAIVTPPVYLATLRLRL